MKEFLLVIPGCPAWQCAMLLGLSELVTSCGGGYESCEATLSCPVASRDGGSGASGAGGTLPEGSAGTAGSGGAAGAVGTAGSDGSAGNGTNDAGMDAPDSQPDSTPPRVLSVTPMDGARGVPKDASISIVFSEPMDDQKTRAAYESIDLPPSAVNFSWSPDGTVLRVSPNAELNYIDDVAPGVSPAKTYAFSIATTAADRAGNSLETRFSAGFSTLRRLTHSLTAVTWRLINDQQTGSGEKVYDCVGEVDVGDDYLQVNYGALFVFDFSMLPMDMTSMESATLSAIQSRVEGGVFDTGGLDQVVCEHVFFDPVSTASLNPLAIRRLGVLSISSLSGPRSLDVLAAAREDYEQRNTRSNRSQYRVMFTKQTDGDTSGDVVYFSCVEGSKPTLTLRYLTP
jgi:hypothetical protein